MTISVVPFRFPMMYKNDPETNWLIHEVKLTHLEVELEIDYTLLANISYTYGYCDCL